MTNGEKNRKHNAMQIKMPDMAIHHRLQKEIEADYFSFANVIQRKLDSSPPRYLAIF